MDQLTACPDRGVLVRLASGQLPAAEKAALEQHVAKCASCAGMLRGLQGRDPSVQTIAADAPSPVGEQAATVDGTAALLQPAARSPSLTFLAPAQQPDEIGRLANYRVLKQLGAGGMGAVFLAEDISLERPVALKVMLPQAAEKKDAGTRFLREAKLTASIKNDHIVTIYQVGQQGDLPFLAMELLDGVSLEERLLRAEPKRPVPEVLRIGREIALGLEAAHARGLIHRDIKPANIWLEAPNDRVKILDFGLARPVDSGEHLTQSGVILGTPAYMAPEQAENLTVDGRADLFSLGCVLYRLCTGKMAFSGPTLMAILRSLATSTPPSVSQLRPGVPPRLTKLIDRLLAKDPAGRPASARAVVDEIAAIEKALNAPPVVRPLGPPRKEPPSQPPVVTPRPAAPEPDRTAKLRVRRRAPSRRWPWVVAALLLLGGGILAWVLLGTSPAKGTLVIDTDERGVEIVVRRNGAIVIDRTSQRRIELPAGDYEIELAEKKEGLKLSPEKFTIKPGDSETVKVWLDKAPVKPPVVPVKTYDEMQVPFFNGKDLSGWEGLPGFWQVKDGAIVGTVTPQNEGAVTCLCSKRQYRDFELKFQVRLTGDPALVNSGVQFRGEVANRSMFTVRGPQADMGFSSMGQNDWGSLYDSGRKQHLKRADADLVQKVLRPGEFNDYFLRVVGNRVTIRLNEATTIDEEFADLPPEGIIAFELLRRYPPMEVAFRNIQFTDLTGFVPLFDGKSMVGWKEPPEQPRGWIVQDGNLIGRSKTQHHLFSERADYENFHLRAEARVNRFGNSGILFRCPFDVTGTPLKGYPDGYEAQILHSYPLPNGYLTGSLMSTRGKFSKVSKPLVQPDEWFTMDVIAEGNHLIVKINGEVTTDVVDLANTFRVGHIALQAMSDTTTNVTTSVEFRRIEIKELPRNTPPFVSLFNGRDLTGWRNHPQDAGKARWEVKDGILIGSGGPDLLYSERGDYRNFHYRLEAMINDGGNSGQYFRAQFQPGFPPGYEAQINATHRDPIKTGSLYPAFDRSIQGEALERILMRTAPHKPDEWLTQDVIAHDNHIIIKVNGKTTVDYIDEKNTHTAGHLGIQGFGPGNVVKVRKIEIKELP
jgi:serine/threonine protein kinase